MKLLTHLRNWLDHGGGRIGEICIFQQETGFRLRHEKDADMPASALKKFSGPQHSLEIAKLDAAGEFRPLKSAPTLKTGWELHLSDLEALLLALDGFYPAGIANWARYQETGQGPIPLRAYLGRQTGMYRVTQLAQEPEAEAMIAEHCHAGKCTRRMLWGWEDQSCWPGLPKEKCAPAQDFSQTWPLVCLHACPLLVGAIRGAVKERLNRQK
jgi:sirohydrochlorin cobaltochelatase